MFFYDNNNLFYLNSIKVNLKIFFKIWLNGNIFSMVMEKIVFLYYIFEMKFNFI